ncbi:MAG TPA: DUF2161 family putative PD-(D/E)XK-type phosphodiesterase [Pseudomonadales bacterium]|nr:DUF2161 family putative PD-(D/E)XK-type phosphodiesterase [Pseudomonadales bacterium]
MRETDLYAPVKAFLEALAYEVKAEIGPADVMAVREDAEPIVVELKTAFSLQLFHQGIARMAISDAVYVAVPHRAGRPFRRALKENLRLARRLGLGLMTVVMETGHVEVHCDPGPCAPRRQPRRRAALLREFARRRGDPNTGGMRGARMTAYRQDALACATYLAGEGAEAGAAKGAAVARATGVAGATRLMRDNHYGWFERVMPGHYALTAQGRAALLEQSGGERATAEPASRDTGSAL